MAKGGNHQNARALETHSNAIPWNIQMNLHFLWSRTFKCSVKDLGDWALNQTLFLTNLHMLALLHNQWKEIKGYKILKCLGHPDLC